MTVETKKSVCYFCKGYCSVLVHSENGRLLSVEPNPDDPTVDGVFPRVTGCVRRRAAKEFMYHPDRLKFPLKRAGERGEGKWQQVSWDQAFDEIATKLQQLKAQYGAETLAGLKGTMRNQNFMPRLFNLFGSPNCATIGKICYGPLFAVGNAMFGCSGFRYSLPGGHRVIGAPTPKCMFLTGTDPYHSWPRVAEMIERCKKAGGKLIIVDPRETVAAKKADLWLQLRPGTDTALFMAMINVIIAEGLYDKEFVQKWCYGFDQLAERAREYPLEKAAEITWVPAEKIRQAARMLGKNSPFFTFNGMGTEQLVNGVQAIHARLILAAITGSIDAEGGTWLDIPKGGTRGDILALSTLSPEQRRKQLGADRFKFQALPGYEAMAENTMRVWGAMPTGDQMAIASSHQPSMYRAMLTGKPYWVKALITMAHCPMTVQCNTKLVYKALKSLDLHVVLDYWMTPTADLADYVLPVASWLERAEFMADYGGVQAIPSVMPGEYDRKTDYAILRGIGTRLGQDWPWQDHEDVYDYILESRGMTYQQFLEKGGSEPAHQYRKYEKVGFATTTGKAELYSTILEKLGYDPLPQYEEPPETPISQPDLAKEFPLILITGGRFRPLFHSEWRQIESIRKMHPDPLVQLNPATAKNLGIQDGDWAWIESPRGKIRMKCQLFDGIDPRVVHCQHGWWFPELPAEEPWLHGVWESNVNVLTDDDPDHSNPINGGWPLRTALCKISKAKRY